MEKNKSPYDMLSKIDVSKKTEKKGNLTYLSWAWAWAEAKKVCPTLTRTVYEGEDGMNYFTDGKTAWVKVGVTIDGLEHIDYLPIMTTQGRPRSIQLEAITSFEVNTAIQRSTTKALALHGLGLNVYAGEDLPMSEAKDDKPKIFSLDIGDANWKKVLGYVADNKELGLTKIVKNLGVKYKITPKVKTELNKVIKS
jgi:hypothetical protein